MSNFNKVLNILNERNPDVVQNRDYEMTEKERLFIFKELRTDATNLARKLEKYSKDKDFNRPEREVFTKCEALVDQVRSILFDAE